MPSEIVTETCPAPECNLSEKDIEQCLDEMTDYIEMLEPAFQRVEQLERSKVYVRGAKQRILSKLRVEEYQCSVSGTTYCLMNCRMRTRMSGGVRGDG